MKTAVNRAERSHRYTFLLTVVTMILIFGVLLFRNYPEINLPSRPTPAESGQQHALLPDKQAEPEDIDASGFIFYDVVLPAWAKGFKMPLAGIPVPQRREQLPSAVRAYRNGRHEGVDIYCAYGTPVLAAKDGYVLTVSANYSELSPAFRNRLLGISHKLVSTPAEVTDILHGRRVIIDHGYTAGRWVITVYSHLAEVESGLIPGASVRQGAIIGYVGNSGTSQAGTRNESHLHFEIRVNDHYLGEGMSQEEAGRLYSLVLGGGQK